MRVRVREFGPFVAAAAVVCIPVLAHAQGRGPELPPGEGRDIVQSVCATACHQAVTVLLKRDGESGWRATAERMVVQKGARIAPAEMETIIRYLSTALGPGSGRMPTPGPLPPGSVAGGAKMVADVRLPEGEGKTLVETRCAACHDLGRVVSYRRTRAEWDHVTRNMMGRFPQTPSAQDVTAITTYLTTHFGR
jgi:mono/diheme cytochrome c family protein